MEFVPGYRKLWQAGTFKERVEQLRKIYTYCTACPRRCGIDRLNGEKGHCNASALPFVSSVSPHFGEEPPLVGYYGSGTIFFTGCNLNCIYCQNYDISQLYHGETVSYEQLAMYMLNLQERGCHNINFVTPTHQVYAILMALEIATERGLKLPLVYNSGGYDNVETLKILNGIIDIYMPDFKYWHPESGNRLSNVPDYPEVAKQAIKEMYRQVGDLKVDISGVAYRGLIVRHLALPGHIEESKEIIDFIGSISKGIYLNIMDQYRPEYRACEIDILKSRVSRDEYNRLIDFAVKKGIKLAE